MIDINNARPYVCCISTIKGNKSFIELRDAAAEPCDKLTAITKAINKVVISRIRAGKD